MAAIFFGQAFADVLEVDVLEEQKQGRQQNAGHEKEESGQELLQCQRI